MTTTTATETLTNAPNWKLYILVCDTVDMTAMCGDKFLLKNEPFGLTRK